MQDTLMFKMHWSVDIKVHEESQMDGAFRPTKKHLAHNLYIDEKLVCGLKALEW